MRARAYCFRVAMTNTATVSVSRLRVLPGHGANKKSEEDHRPGRASGGSERARGEHSSGRASARMVWMRDLVVTVVSDRCRGKAQRPAAAQRRRLADMIFGARQLNDKLHVSLGGNEVLFDGIKGVSPAWRSRPRYCKTDDGSLKGRCGAETRA